MKKIHFSLLEPRLVFDGAGFDTLVFNHVSSEQDILDSQEEITLKEPQDFYSSLLIETQTSKKHTILPLHQKIVACILTVTHNFYQKVFYDQKVEEIIAKAEDRPAETMPSSTTFPFVDKKIVLCSLDVGESLYAYIFHKQEENISAETSKPTTPSSYHTDLFLTSLKNQEPLKNMEQEESSLPKKTIQNFFWQRAFFLFHIF